MYLLFRQYEEKQLKSQQERAKKRLEFTNQESRLQNQVCYYMCIYTIVIFVDCFSPPVAGL